jgi:hypothetical protein
MSLTIDGHRIDVLFSEPEIRARINELAGEIAARNPHRLLVVPVLKGSFIFAADLIRAMHHAGPFARGGFHDPCELPRGHPLVRQGGRAARHRIGGEGPRRAAGR